MRESSTRYILCFAGILLGAALIASCNSQGLSRPLLGTGVQSQLDALQTPVGVDPQVFTLLKDELARQLAARGKTASRPPTGVANTPANVYFTDAGGGNHALHWEYRNIGDYGQNGTVDISDITPLAQHFGESYDLETEPKPLQAVIDGSGNGTVGIEDVTPIAQNFGVDVAHYVVDSCTTENGTYGIYVMLPWSDAAGGTDGWKTFTSTEPFDPALWYTVHPEDLEGNAGQACAPLQIGGGGGAPVITEVLPQSGKSGASYSPIATNTGGAATSASWDFGGGATPNNPTDINPTVTLGAVNSYSASVTLTNASDSDTYDFILTVTSPAGAWEYYNILASSNVGSYISFAFIDGLPAFAYVNTNDGTLHYVRATAAVPASSGEWVDMVVDTSLEHWYDGEVSLIEDSYGTPIILAYDSGDSAAIYVGSNVITPDGAADWEVSVVREPVSEAGSLTLAEGDVFATYKDLGGLYFAEATTYPPVDATSWEETSVDAAIGAGSFSRIKYNDEDGRFYIMAYNQNATELYMSHCLFDDRANPASWVTFVTSSNIGLDEGMFFDFAFDPAALSDDVFCVYSRDYVGTTGTVGVLGFEGAPNRDDFVLNVILYEEGMFQGEFCSLAFEENLLAFSYNRTTPADLMVAISPFTQNQTPTGWVEEFVPDPSASLIADTNLLIYNGNRLMVVYGREDGIYFATAPLT